MRRRLIGSAILVALLTALGFVFRSSAGDQPLPCRQHLQKTFLQDQKWVQRHVSDTLLPGYFSSAKGLRYLNETQVAVETLSGLNHPRISMFLYEADSLVAWTGSGPLPPLNQVSETPGLVGNEWYARHEIDTDHFWISRINLDTSRACDLPAGTFSVKGNYYQFTFGTGTDSDKGYLSAKQSFFLFAAALIVLLSLFFGGASVLLRSGKWFTGGSFWALGLIALVISASFLFGTAPFRHWLFAPNWTGNLIGPTVIDYLWQSILLVLSMSLFRKFLQPNLRAIPNTLRAIIAIAQYIFTGGFLIIWIWVQRYLVLESDAWLQLDNVFRFDGYTIAGCLGMSLWSIAFFLASHRAAELARQVIRQTNKRILLMVVVSIGLLPLFIALDTGVPNLAFPPLLLIYLIILDLFFDRNQSDITWFIFLLITFCLFNAIILYGHSLNRDGQAMAAYAKKLSEAEDSILLQRIEEYQTATITTDQWIKKVQVDPYILRHYEIDEKTKPLFNRRDSTVSFLREQRPAGLDTYWFLGEQDTLSIYRPLRPVSFYRPYEDVLQVPQYRDLPQLNRYRYLVFRNQRVVDQQSIPNRTLLKETNRLEIGSTLQTVNWSSQAVLFRYADEGWVLLERGPGGILKPLSLCAFFFISLLLLSLVIALCNPFLRIAEGNLITLFGSTSSLRTKVQLAILGLIVTSFTAIAWMTISSFRQSTITEQETQLLKRITSIQASLSNAIDDDPTILASSQSLDSISRKMLEEYQLDINFYNRNGRRIASSSGDIPFLSNLHTLMHASAYESLRTGLEEYRIVEDQWGDISFKTVYVPLRERSRLYIGVPYYAQNREMLDDLYIFMGKLFSIYVSALLVAVAVSLFVSNQITRPLESIRTGIRNLRLGSNEPLAYQGNDEIGELVREYNDAIHKLEESTELLRKSERESAWREMAKQVAHEIKNPLTPMKLRIQHLMRAYQQDPERAAPMVKKVSNSLIEQIDTLTRIANEFSRFAKMPKPQNVDFDLQKLLESVTTVFAEEDAGRVLLASDLTTAPVRADRDHLTRVLNNLIKNGLQAIPDNREGIIRVTLTRHEHHFLITVTDNGNGIPEDIQHKVFSPNFTTKSSGTGLGLAMSRQMIEQAGGRIYFETEPEVGTTFFVEIPRQV